MAFRVFARRFEPAQPSEPTAPAGIDALFGPRPAAQTPTPPTPTAPEIPRDASELIRYFESLGDNCEFGFVQRHLACERPGPLRFNASPIGPLIAGFDKAFADVAEPGNLTATFENGEWLMHEARYGFHWHTFRTNAEADTGRLIREQSTWLNS